MISFLTKSRKNFLIVFSIFIGVIQPLSVFAQISSTNFQMISDSVNCGGGRSSSTSFSVMGTLCEPISMPPTNNIAFPTSSNFNLEQGFPTMDDIPFISVSLLNSAGTAAKSSIAFNTLTQGSVGSDTILVRVSTNAANGYSAVISSDGGLLSSNDEIQPVSDGTVDGSSSHGEYGFAVASSDTSNCTRPTGDRAITTTGTNFATCTTWKTQSDTTLTFKAAVGGGNASGSFGQALTVIVTGSF